MTRAATIDANSLDAKSIDAIGAAAWRNPPRLPGRVSGQVSGQVCGQVRDRVRGFTIMELMVVMAIVGVLASFAVPAMRDMVLSARLRTAVSDLYSTLVFARAEAIKRNANIVITPVGGDWRSGWNVTSGATVLKTQDALLSTLDSLGGTAITYRGNGRVTVAATFVFAFTTEYPSLAARCVRIDASGRPNTTSDTDGNAANGCN